MGQCNYCTFEDLKKEVKKHTNLRWTAVTQAEGPLKGWVSVYVHPQSIVIEDLTPEQREQWFKESYMELPSKCACDED